jgi:hypothetical protein
MFPLEHQSDESVACYLEALPLDRQIVRACANPNTSWKTLAAFGVHGDDFLSTALLAIRVGGQALTPATAAI